MTLEYANVTDITFSATAKGLILHGFAKGYQTPTQFQNPREHGREFRAKTALPAGWSWASPFINGTLGGSTCEALVIAADGQLLQPELLSVAIAAAREAKQDRLRIWLETLQTNF